MRIETRRSLDDARAAAEHARRLATPGWQENETTGLAIERLLSIMGEALLRVRNSERSVFDVIEDAPSIVGMRNVIVHGYDALDRQRMQLALDEGLPKFIADVTKLLA